MIVRVAAMLAGAIALGIAHGEARAEDTAVPPDEPAALFAAGTRAYEAGDYATAIAAYEEVYRRAPLPGAAFSLAQAHRNRYFVDGDPLHLRRALALYRSYLASAPRGPHRQHAAMHAETIELLLAHLPPAEPSAIPAPPSSTQLLVSSDAIGARASIDGDEGLPTPRLAEVSPGPHVVRVEAPGHEPIERRWPAVEGKLVVVPLDPVPRPAQLRVEVPAGARLLVNGVELRAHAGPIDVSAGTHDLVVLRRGHRAATRRVTLGFGEERTVDIATTPTRQRRIARALVWSGVALVAGAGGVALFALDAQGDAEALPPPPRDTDDLRAYADARSRRDAWRTTAVSLGVAGAAAAVTAAALWHFDSPSAPPRAAPTIEPLLGSDRVGMSLTMELE
jgi:hypothetical protein